MKGALEETACHSHMANVGTPAPTVAWPTLLMPAMAMRSSRLTMDIV